MKPVKPAAARDTEHVGLLIAMARSRIRQAVGALVRPYALSAQQFWILVHIDESAGMSLCQIAERQRMDAPTASRVVTTLLRRKLVRMERDPHDRRRTRIRVSAAGEALCAELRPIAAEWRRVVVRGMTDDEKAALRAGLRKVMANIDGFETDRERQGARRDRAPRSRVRARTRTRS